MILASLALEAVIIFKVQLLHLLKGYLQSKLSPPIKESHVEMDAAWALYESMLKS